MSSDTGPKLAYSEIEESGKVYYIYPPNGFKTCHLPNMKRHILKRDPTAVVELPKPKKGAEAGEVAPLGDDKPAKRQARKRAVKKPTGGK